jgi:hypothetical protein
MLQDPDGPDTVQFSESAGGDHPTEEDRSPPLGSSVRIQPPYISKRGHIVCLKETVSRDF